MIHHCLCAFQSLLLIALLPAVSLAVPGSDRTIPDKQAISDKLPRIHVPFIENRGQVGDAQVIYYARTFGGTLFVTQSGEMVYSLPYREKSGISQKDFPRSPRAGNEKIMKEGTVQGVTLKETLVGAAVKSIQGKELSSSKVSYFQGSESSRWHTELGTYETVTLGEIYPGIELELKAYGNNVEKLFTVKGHTDPGLIRVSVEGAKTIRIAENGELEVITDRGPVRFTKPVAFQDINGKHVDVPVRYDLTGMENEYRFIVADYDRTRDLFIDPLLASTFLGSVGDEMAQAIALDASGNVYVAGFTNSSDFPTETGFYDASWNGTNDVFVAKFSGDLTQLLASTFLGGSNDDGANTIAVDGSGNVYVAGSTKSGNFPFTASAYDPSRNGAANTTDAFVSKLSGDLTQLLASTFLGGTGSDAANAMVLDAAGNVYVTGFTYSSDFPVTAGAYDMSNPDTNYADAFISKLSGNLQQLLVSTLLGNDGTDVAKAIALDSTGNVYVAGYTSSTVFPTTSGAYDQSGNGYSDAFISKFDGALNTLLGSTYLGGSYDDQAYAIALDPSGKIYLVGYTGSANFPTIAGAYQTSYISYEEAFVSRLTSDLTLLEASTYLGGSGSDYGCGIALDAAGNVYVAGYTGSVNFPTKAGAYDVTFNGSADAFLSRFSRDLERLLGSTFLGGGGFDAAYAIVLDASRNIYVTGNTGSSMFPAISGVYDRSFNGGQNPFAGDVFVSKFDSSFRKLDPKGDVDRNDIVNLADAILAIQVSSGMSSANVTLDADVNVDDRIGLAEVIYILQKVAGIRQ